MKIFLKFWILGLSILFIGCTNDDENSTLIENPFTFQNNTYNLKTVWINDFNTDNNEPSRIDISIANKTEVEMNNSTDIVAIRIGINDVTVTERAYSELVEYDILIDGETSNGFFTSQNVILTDDYIGSSLELHASNFDFRITEFNENTIGLIFSFTRADGEEISGEYNGPYID